MEKLTLKVAIYLVLIKDNKILLGRRTNTGWMDGYYSLPAGHLERQETLIEAVIREAKEEIGVDMKSDALSCVHVMHRKSAYIDFYFTAKEWGGKPRNVEPEVCDDLGWFSLDALPEQTVPSVTCALQNYKDGVMFSEFVSEQ